MPTVQAIIRRLLPKGSNPHDPGVEPTWEIFPAWPPDLFAVTAALVDRSGCYSHPKIIGDWGTPIFDGDYLGEVRRLSGLWQQLFDSKEERPKEWSPASALPEIQGYWSALQSLNEEVRDPNPLEDPEPKAWWGIAVKLMAIADEASEGIGFILLDQDESYQPPPGAPPGGINPVALYYIDQYRVWDDWNRNAPSPDIKLAPDELVLRYLTSSLCQMVPAGELCVQPKTRTSQIGCTLRSMSHHLALLPPIGEVATHWFMGTPQNDTQPEPLNLLLIPFPYHIDGVCFKQGRHTLGSEAGKWNDGTGNKSFFFQVNQDWLGIGAERLTASKLVSFIINLVEQAAGEVNSVDGVILPEFALTKSLAQEVARELAKVPGMELFISGVFSDEAKDGRGQRNAVYTCIFHGGEPAMEMEQFKHHRWMLERHQITRYHLGACLDPDARWWELIDLSPRRCFFGVFRHRACLTTIVCEDLARIDPVQTVIRSVGPNLLVALLMDGPQLERRWSGRYATVLADDPGCAVLTLTSLGMVLRSVMPGEQEPRQIALWKQPGGDSRELNLPKGAHALLLSLTTVQSTNFTLDGRCDRHKRTGQGGTLGLSLTGVRAITHPAPVPSWVAGAPLRA
jgi:hypothetical protein